jgi:hypothetical protein
MSLHVPEHFKIFRVMGFDPGLVNAGVSVIDVDYTTKRLMSVTAFTLVPAKLETYQNLYPGIDDSPINRIYRLTAAFRYLLEFYNPCAVASEDAFYHPKMPNAYGVLNNKYPLYVKGADHYYNPNKVDTPDWAYKMKKVGKIGNHLYLSSNESYTKSI